MRQAIPGLVGARNAVRIPPGLLMLLGASRLAGVLHPWKRVLERKPDIWRLVVVALATAYALMLVDTVRAQGNGVLEGQVVNGTAGGAEVGAGLPVTLYAFRGNEEVGFWETTTDAEGRFRFEGLDTDADVDYWPEVVYLDVSYRTETPHRFEGDLTTGAATVTVYETTDDDSAVRLDSIHMIAESFGQVLRISEIYLFGNDGDRTYVGRDGETVSITLPERAVGLAFQEGTPGDRYIEVEGGLRDTEPLLPGAGTSMAFFSYHLMVDGDTVPLARRFDYPVATMNMLVAQPGLTMQTEQMQAQGSELFQDRQYDFFVASNLTAGETVEVEFRPTGDVSSGEGMPGASTLGDQGVAAASERGSQGLLRWLGFALAGLAVVGVVVYAAAARQPATSRASTRDLTSNPKARSILVELADLEGAFEAGQIDEATYERQRAEKYEALKSL